MINIKAIIGSLFISTFIYGYIYSFFSVLPLEHYLIYTMGISIMQYNLLHSAPFWLRWTTNSLYGYIIGKIGVGMSLILSSLLVVIGQIIFVIGVFFDNYAITCIGRSIIGLNFSRAIQNGLCVYFFKDDIPIASSVLGIMRSAMSVLLYATTQIIIHSTGIHNFLIISLSPSIFSLLTSLIYYPYHKLRVKKNQDHNNSIGESFELVWTLPRIYWLFIITFLLIDVATFIILSNITLLLQIIYDLPIATSNYYAIIQPGLFIVIGLPVGWFIKQYKLSIHAMIISSILCSISCILFLFEVNEVLTMIIFSLSFMIFNIAEFHSMVLSILSNDIIPELLVDLKAIDYSSNIDNIMKHIEDTIPELEMIAADNDVDIDNILPQDELEDNEIPQIIRTQINIATGIKEAIEAPVLFVGLLSSGFIIQPNNDTNSDGMSFDFRNFLILSACLSFLGLISGLLYLFLIKKKQARETNFNDIEMSTFQSKVAL